MPNTVCTVFQKSIPLTMFRDTVINGRNRQSDCNEWSGFMQAFQQTFKWKLISVHLWMIKAIEVNSRNTRINLFKEGIRYCQFIAHLALTIGNWTNSHNRKLDLHSLSRILDLHSHNIQHRSSCHSASDSMMHWRLFIKFMCQMSYLSVTFWFCIIWLIYFMYFSYTRQLLEAVQ